MLQRRRRASASRGVDAWAELGAGRIRAESGPDLQTLPPDVTVRRWHGTDAASEVAFYRIDVNGLLKCIATKAVSGGNGTHAFRGILKNGDRRLALPCFEIGKDKVESNLRRRRAQLACRFQVPDCGQKLSLPALNDSEQVVCFRLTWILGGSLTKCCRGLIHLSLPDEAASLSNQGVRRRLRNLSSGRPIDNHQSPQNQKT